MTRHVNSMSVSRVLFSLLLLASSALHADTVDHWLDKMMQGMMESNYRGTLVIRQDDKLQALRVNHGHGEEGNWETLESLNGEPRQVIRKDNRVTTIFPDRKLVTISEDMVHAPLHPQLPQNRELLKQYYDIQLQGEDRVAGKQTRILEIMPRDQYRYGFKFWLEQDSGLLLKCDMLNGDRKIIEQLMYSELDFLAQSPAISMPELKDFKVIDLDRERQPQTASPWQARRLPQGFRLTQSSIKPSFHGEGVVHHLVYSDGMASVSVFVEQQMPDKHSLNGISSMGALNAFGQSVRDHHVTVIGEVPVSTVKLIGESFVQDDMPGED